MLKRSIVLTAAVVAASISLFAAPQQAPLNIKLATQAPANTSWHKALLEMGEAWTRDTGGSPVSKRAVIRPYDRFCCGSASRSAAHAASETCSSAVSAPSTSTAGNAPVAASSPSASARAETAGGTAEPPIPTWWMHRWCAGVQSGWSRRLVRKYVEPLPADHGQEDAAVREAAVDRLDEVLPRLEGVDVPKDALGAHATLERFAETPGVARRVLTPVADEGAYHT